MELSKMILLLATFLIISIHSSHGQAADVVITEAIPLTTGIRVSWTYLGNAVSELDRYTVRFRYMGPCQGVNVLDLIVTVRLLTATSLHWDRDLLPFSDYLIIVTAHPLAGSTSEDSTTVSTFPATPGAPINIRAADLTTSSATIVWDPVPCLQRNDEIVEYMVDIGISGNVALRVRLVENGTSLTETGLEAGMSYFFEVFAVGNSTGQGVGATPLHLQTLLGGLPTSDGGLPTSDGGLPTSDGGLPTSDGGLPTSDGGLPTSDGGLQSSDSSDITVTVAVLSVFLSGLLVVVVLVAVILVLVFYRRKKTVDSVRNLATDRNLYLSDNMTVRKSTRIKVPKNLIIDSANLELDEAVGQGEYGIVYKGKLSQGFNTGFSEVVAVKTLKGFLEKSKVRDLLQECTQMSEFDHPNVLTLKGVCLDGGPAPYIVMPFMFNGSLLSYLKKERDHLVLPPQQELDSETVSISSKLMDMCIQVAKGMEYLASKRVVHRDLAARNCMIDINFVIKVADFGLSETIDPSKDYFRQDKTDGMKLPVKWLAPESLSDGKFSEKSDVWAFGVTCWEVFSGGKIPYSGINPVELPRMLEDGYRMEKPSNSACLDEMFDVVKQCWAGKAEDRPTFSDISTVLSKSLEALTGYTALVADEGLGVCREPLINGDSLVKFQPEKA